MQVTEHVHAIKIPFQVMTDSEVALDRFVYTYLIYGEKIWVVDSGVASSEGFILDYLEKTGRTPSDISLMILTHSHPDHIGSGKSLKQKSGCEVAAHWGEKSWIEDVNLQSRERPVPNFHSLVEGSVQVEHILEDGNVLDLNENVHIEVIHTPGHSKGSISLFIPEERVLITGDSVPLKGDLPIYEDFTESIGSIEKLRAIEDIEVLLASWDDPQKGKQAHQRMDEGLNYLQNIHKLVNKINTENPSLKPIELCRLVLKELGLPEQAANPIVARSFQANLQVIK